MAKISNKKYLQKNEFNHTVREYVNLAENYFKIWLSHIKNKGAGADKPQPQKR